MWHFYSGLVYGFNQIYNNAVIVDAGSFEIDADNTGVTVVSKLVSLIPFAGEMLETAVEKIGTFAQKASIKKAASNVAKLADSPAEFSELTQDFACPCILRFEKELEDITPEKRILPEWAGRFEQLAKWINNKKEEV